jgi:hypothetical protein
MSEFRRGVLDESDIPPDLRPDLALVYKQQAAAAVLLMRDREAYPRLLERFRSEGASYELSMAALEAAGDLATVCQALRARQDILQVMDALPDVIAPPLVVLDQLFYSYLLITGAATDVQSDGPLEPEGLDKLINTKRVSDWLEFALGPDAGA